jgi:ABC-type Zn uptake system ZnuABC Zn-binding protein ZnuA
MASNAPAGASSSKRLTVDSTVAPITNIVRNVVGDRVKLVGLIPEGVDSHTFEPSPDTVKKLADADILFMDGLNLEGSTLKQARENMPEGSKIVQLGRKTVKPSGYAFDFTFPKSKGDPNPHLWMSPSYAKRFAEIVSDTMAERDPENAAYYRTNYELFAAALDKLDSAVAESINSIPEDHKILLTYHDSFAYFSRRYGIPVLGAVQPADFSEPSAREIRDLIDQVKANHVPAIFGSEVFPSPVLKEVADETGAQFVDKLRDDELPGKESAKNHTYIGLMVEDVKTMTSALGGDPSPLTRVPTQNTFTE